MRVRDLMATPVVTISPDDTAQSAARLMLEADIGALPVEVPGVGTIVGIVTDRDIVRSVVARGLATTATVAEFMTVCAETCNENDDTDLVAQRMQQLDIHRLVVLDDNRKAVGIVSRGDLTTEDAAERRLQ